MKALILMILFGLINNHIIAAEINIIYKGNREYDKIKIGQFNIITEKFEILGFAAPKEGSKNLFVFKFNNPVKNNFIQIFNNFIYLTGEKYICIEITESLVMDAHSKYIGNFMYNSYFSNIDSPSKNFKILKTNILNYKVSLKKYLSDKNALLETYKKNGYVSNEFYKFQLKENYYQYLSSLLLVNSDTSLILPENYLDEISAQELSSTISSSAYYRFLMAYNSFLYKQKISSFDNFSKRSKDLKLIFGKNTYDFLLFHNFRISRFESEDDYLKAYVLASKIITNSELKEQLSLKKATKLKIGKVILDEVKEDSFLDSFGNVLSLEEILNNQNGKFTYFDFWASWCAPCIKEIPHSNILESSLYKTDISFIYISIDNNKQSWLNSLDKHNLNKDNQYLLLNPEKSNIVKYLEISSIPQYYILGKNRELLFFKTVRPSDSEIKIIFNNILKLKN